MVLKLKLPKNNSNKKCAPKILFLNEKKIRKIRMIFDIENSLWKSKLDISNWRMSKISKIPVQIDRRIVILYQNHCGKSSPLGTQIPSFFVIYSVFFTIVLTKLALLSMVSIWANTISIKLVTDFISCAFRVAITICNNMIIL